MQGGLALPNLSFYYWASHIKFMTYWLVDNGNPLTWLQLELEACQPYCIEALLLSPLPIDKSIYDGNVVIHSSIHILKQIKLHSPITPIVGNPSFKPSILDKDFGNRYAFAQSVI